MYKLFTSLFLLGALCFSANTVLAYEQSSCPNSTKTQCECSKDCTCGCQDGEKCTCDKDYTCGCQDGEQCTCDEDCTCAKDNAESCESSKSEKCDCKSRKFRLFRKNKCDCED